MDRFYLGDGAYVEYDGYSYRIFTNNGVKDTNTVILEPDHMESLIAFVNRIKKQNVSKVL